MDCWTPALQSGPALWSSEQIPKTAVPVFSLSYRGFSEPPLDVPKQNNS